MRLSTRRMSVSEREYPSGVKAALFTLSRGTCYFPGCTEPVVLFEGDGMPILRLEIAHINGVRGKRQRYDELLQEPNGFSNLILLCVAHHKLVDKIAPEKYSDELLREWKRQRETAGLSELAGLRNVTEDRLQELLSASYESIGEQLDVALETLRAIDQQAAGLLRVLRNELVDALPRRPILNLEAVDILSHAANDLRHLPESADVLDSVAESLKNLRRDADRLLEAASELETLPDTVEALRRVVSDLQRYGPQY
jgi:polyhydroxyalkanoate synthesis regulator phasin